MRRLFIGAALLLTLPVSASAELYQYTDKNGNTVYTDTPPQHTESKPAKVREDGVYWSSQRTPPPDPERVFQPKNRKPAAEEPKKNYSRLNVAIYMTDW